MVLVSHIIIITSHMLIHIITLLDILILFIYLNLIYIKLESTNMDSIIITYDGNYIIFDDNIHHI